MRTRYAIGQTGLLSNPFEPACPAGTIPPRGRRMKPVVSIAIETTCRRGGLVLGRGDRPVRVVDFDASARQATQVVAQLAELGAQEGVTPSDIHHLYVCVGPGSFTGARIGVTVARVIAQAVPAVRCVAVPAPHALAEQARDLPWQHLGVVLDARQGLVYAALFARDAHGNAVPAGKPCLVTAAELLRLTPRPLTLTGEGLAYHDLSGRGVELLPEDLRLPTALGVWHVGRQMAGAGAFVPYSRLRPVYARKPEAIRLRAKRRASAPAQDDAHLPPAPQAATMSPVNPLERAEPMQVDTQFSVFLINKPGVLAAVTGALAKAKVNIIALSLSDSGEHGVLRIVAEDPDTARQVLNKAHDRWTETEVLTMEMENRSGAFARAAQHLADEHINISYAYCTGGAKGGRTTAVFKVADMKKALKVFAPQKARKKPDPVREPPSHKAP